MTGDAMAWQKEKSEPSAPPSRTMSYRSLIGLAKVFLYALRRPRTRERSVGLDDDEVTDASTAR
jgi:hypothetical protein